MNDDELRKELRRRWRRGIFCFIVWLLLAAPAFADPITTNGCDGKFNDPRNQDYSILIGVSFTNVSVIAATDVKFRFDLRDAFGKTLESETGTVSGVFSPNVLIQPQRASLTGVYLPQPQFPNSSAWELDNFSGKDVTSVRCTVTDVRFMDGTVWTNASSP